MEKPSISQLGADERHDLCQLDPALLKKHRHWNAAGKWSGQFTVAVWLRFPESLMENVQLWLNYRDGERRKSLLIDKCYANRQTLSLLNGKVNLEVSGKVVEMSLFLQGLSPTAAWILDEYRFEPHLAAAAVNFKRAN